MVFPSRTHLRFALNHTYSLYGLSKVPMFLINLRLKAPGCPGTSGERIVPINPLKGVIISTYQLKSHISLSGLARPFNLEPHPVLNLVNCSYRFTDESGLIVSSVQSNIISSDLCKNAALTSLMHQ